MQIFSFSLQAMGRIFVGLCQVGAWGCFDEFNRLEERMLSAVSQQVQYIQVALREHINPNRDRSTYEKELTLVLTISFYCSAQIFIRLVVILTSYHVTTANFSGFYLID